MRPRHHRWWLVSYEAMTWAMYEAPRLLNKAGNPHCAARSVLFVMAEKAKPDGTDAFPGAELVSDVTGLDETTIRRAVRYLEEAKFIERDRTTRNGAIVWRLNMSLTRTVSHKQERAEKERARRAAVAERTRRYRVRDAAKKAAEKATEDADVTGTDAVTSEAVQDDVTGPVPVTTDQAEDDVTGTVSSCDGHCDHHVTGAVPPDPVREPPGTLGGAFARPQTPRESIPGSGSVGGFSTALLDLETCDPCAHEHAPAHTHEATHWSMWSVPALLNELGRRWHIELDEPSLANAACIRGISRALDAKGVTRNVQDAVTKPPADVQDLTTFESTTEAVRPLKKRDHLRVVRDAG